MANKNAHWLVTQAKMSAIVQTSRTPNDATDQILLKNSTILALNITFQENNSLFNQLFSVPIIGMFDQRKNQFQKPNIFNRILFRQLHCNNIGRGVVSPKAYVGNCFEYCKFIDIVCDVGDVFVPWTNKLYINHRQVFYN